MTNDAILYDALCARIISAALVPVQNIAMMGVEFTPPDEVADQPAYWMECRLFPSNFNYGLSNKGPTIYRGVFQISVCCRAGPGVVKLLELVDRTACLFSKGTKTGGVRVYDSPAPLGILEMPERVSVPLTIKYTSVGGC